MKPYLEPPPEILGPPTTEACDFCGEPAEHQVRLPPRSTDILEPDRGSDADDFDLCGTCLLDKQRRATLTDEEVWREANEDPGLQFCRDCEGTGQIAVKRDRQGRVDYMGGEPTGEWAPCQRCNGEGLELP